MTEAYSLFSDMTKRLSVLMDGGLKLPSIFEISTVFLQEILAFTDYVLDVDRDLANDVPYGTGLYESEHIRRWFALFEEEPPVLLTEPVNMGEISDTLCAEMKLSLYQTKAYREFLMLYTQYTEAKRELSKTYFNAEPDAVANVWDNDYLGTTHQLMQRIIQFQNRDYDGVPMFRYNDVTKELEVVYRIPANDVVSIMRHGYY